ncbi:MAG TPA: YiiX/YebB-like N1pC/P60 family cysteine hydrolase [Pirellulales bacterium]|nr:YiiX/YebB-like N1pC/P60 family cysteine hydrolase [Pirellulales bacterium]
MSRHLSAADLAALPVQSYATLREGLRSGDLLFCSGNYTVSKLIERGTKSPWSHVGIILRADRINRVLLLESVEDVGVRLAPVSKYLTDYQDGKPYDGAVAVARHDNLTDADVTAMTQFGVDQLTLPYDNEEIGEIVARIALGIGRRTATSGYICSELVAACFDAAGIRIASDPGGFTTPEDVWVDPHISLLGRVL